MAREVLRKFKVRFYEGIGEPRRGRVEHLPTHVSFKCGQRFGFQRGVDLLEEIRIRDVQLFEFGCADAGEIAIEIKIRAQGDGLFARHFVIAILGIAAFGAIHRSLREGGLDAQHGLGGIGRLFRRLAGQGEDLRDVFDKMLAHLLHLGVVIFDVVVAVGQRQSALIDVSDDLIGVVQVGSGIKIKEWVGPVEMDVGNFLDQCRFVLHRSNTIELRFHGGNPLGVDRLFVHAGAVEVANLLVNGIAAGAPGFGFFEDAALDVFVAFVELDEADP